MRRSTSDAESAFNTYDLVSDRLLGAIAIAVVLSHTLDGPLRFCLYLAHADSLLYLRDAASLLAVSLVIASWLRQRTNAFWLVAATGLLGIHFIVGVLSLNSLLQPLFGFKVCLSILFGMAVAPVVRTRVLARMAALIFCLTCVGVIGNQFLEYPWIGMAYETTFGEAQGSRLWWQGGATRLPGFTRASFCAASYVLLALIPLYVRATWRFRLVLLALSVYVLSLTTTKGTWLGLSAFLAGDFLLAQRRSLRTFAVFTACLTLGCAALPFLLVGSDARLNRMPEWALSFVLRLEEMWPGALALLSEPEQWLWGRGLGGIGVAQAYGDRLPANSADNLMLYLVVTFGCLGLVYGALPIWRVIASLRGSPRLSQAQRCAAGWCCALVAYGYVANMLEEPLLGMAIGIVLVSPMFAYAEGMANRTAGRTRAASHPEPVRVSLTRMPRFAE